MSQGSAIVSILYMGTEAQKDQGLDSLRNLSTVMLSITLLNC